MNYLFYDSCLKLIWGELVQQTSSSLQLAQINSTCYILAPHKISSVITGCRTILHLHPGISKSFKGINKNNFPSYRGLLSSSSTNLLLYIVQSLSPTYLHMSTSASPSSLNRSYTSCYWQDTNLNHIVSLPVNLNSIF